MSGYRVYAQIPNPNAIISKSYTSKTETTSGLVGAPIPDRLTDRLISEAVALPKAYLNYIITNPNQRRQ